MDGEGSTTFINSNLPCTCNMGSTPLLFVTPTNLDFGPASVAKSFLIGNSGGGTLTWTVSESIPWLSVSRLSGTGSATVNVTVDRSSLPTGSYSGSIELSSNGGNATVSVTMEVFAEPVLGVSPSQLHFSPATPNGGLWIWNSGGGTLQWSIATDQPWLSVAPASGTGNATINVIVDRSSLPNGFYSGSIGISSNGGNATVSVTMEVVTGTILGVSPSELHFPATTSNSALSIWNAGAGALYWSISSDQPWLSVVPASGIGADQVAVYVERQGLSPGTYYGNLAVTSNGGNATVPVEMIASDAILIVNPNLLLFTPSATTKTFSISNGGTGVLNWSLDLFDPWVEASPMSGTGTGVVTVNVDVGSLPCCNMLLGHIRVNSNGGSEVIELRAYPTGPGTGGSIGIYADVAGTECNLSDAVVGMTTYRVVHLTDFGVTACAYWAPKPSCFTATYLSDTNVFPVTIGNSQDGVSVGYGSCRPGPIHVQSIAFLTSGNTPECCLYPILGIPSSGNVEAVDCANHLITAYGVTSVINPSGACYLRQREGRRVHVGAGEVAVFRRMRTDLSKMRIVFQPATADRWKDVEKVLGERGGCGGCWCMFWRIPRKTWTDGKGAGNKRALKRVVTRGPMSPPGFWATSATSRSRGAPWRPARRIPALERSRVLKPVDDKPVWSVSCLFVLKAYRRKGVSVRMLEAAAEFARSNGASIVEGYPVEPSSERAPDPFIWTGTASAFRKAGFKEVARRSATRPIMRRVTRQSEKPRSARLRAREIVRDRHVEIERTIPRDFPARDEETRRRTNRCPTCESSTRGRREIPRLLFQRVRFPSRRRSSPPEPFPPRASERAGPPGTRPCTTTCHSCPARDCRPRNRSGPDRSFGTCREACGTTSSAPRLKGDSRSAGRTALAKRMSLTASLLSRSTHVTSVRYEEILPDSCSSTVTPIV